MNNSLDFIGDVHGHCDELRALLQKLGYVESAGAFRYPGGERSVVFLGDYVDRGPDARGALNLVRAMRDAGSAIALLGNHEFNMLSFWQKNGAGGGHFLHRFKDGFLREHSFNKIAIHSRTVTSFVGRKQEFLDALEFVKTLPLYIETPMFRAQHACFDDDAVAVLRREGIAWWKNPVDATFGELSFQPGVSMNIDSEVAPEVRARKFYGENERPVFFGHYWLTGVPKLIRDNVCCLDFSVAGYRGNGRLAAYRFDGEQRLDESKFVWVEASTR